MIITQGNLRSLFVAFNAAFQQGLGMAQPAWNQVATEVPSATSENEYGWLGQMPGMRKWIGDRVVHGIAQHGYSIKNDDFELTIGVPRPKIEDDQYGVYTPMFQEMGRSTSAAPDEQVFGLLKAGDSTKCYDGQNFFDTDHPVLDAQGQPQSVSNWGGGAGTPWYLFDTTRALKPLIFQMRKRPVFVAKDKPEDDNVFDRNEYRYGTDGRWNVGFGFWQLAFGSREELNEANFRAAYTALAERKGDYGRPLGIRPNLLVVPPSLKFQALELVKAERGANGATNVMNNVVDVVDIPWLA